MAKVKMVPVDPATARGETIQASSDSYRARRDNNSGNGSTASAAAMPTLLAPAPPAAPTVPATQTQRLVHVARAL